MHGSEVRLRFERVLRIAVLLSSLSLPRRQPLLLPRELGGLDRGSLYDCLPLANAVVPETHHHQFVQDRWRCRLVGFRVVLAANEAEPYSARVRDEDHEGFPGLAVRVLGWVGASCVGRVAYIRCA